MIGYKRMKKVSIRVCVIECKGERNRFKTYSIFLCTGWDSSVEYDVSTIHDVVFQCIDLWHRPIHNPLPMVP